MVPARDASSNLVEVEQHTVNSAKATGKRQGKAKAMPKVQSARATDRFIAQQNKKKALRAVPQEEEGEEVREGGAEQKLGKRVPPALPDHERRVRFLPQELVDFKAFWLKSASREGVESPLLSRKLGESQGNPMYEEGERKLSLIC